jgi:hypothetical protein
MYPVVEDTQFPRDDEEADRRLRGVQQGEARRFRSIIKSASWHAVSRIQATGGYARCHTAQVRRKMVCSQDAS